MIKKLLAFAGGDRPERKPIDLNEVITEIQELLAHTLPQSIDMEINVEDNLLPIDGDLTELSQVVMNLALNARDAMPEVVNCPSKSQTIWSNHPEQLRAIL